MEVPLGYSSNLLNAVSVFLATLILAYSLLLGSENYQLKADKMLNCGLELGRLSREIALHLSDNSSDTHKRFSEKYHDILEKYENHEDIDFDTYKLKLHAKYYPHNGQKMLYWAVTRAKYRLYFLHYYLAFGLVIAFLWLLVNPST